ATRDGRSCGSSGKDGSLMTQCARARETASVAHSARWTKLVSVRSPTWQRLVSAGGHLGVLPLASMDDSREREHLVQAERHIAEAKAHIARKKKIIAELERGLHETDLAVSTLRALELSLRGFELHRDLILNRLNDPQ